MATAAHYIQLAKALPPRLRTFLARYPAASILPAGKTQGEVQTPYQAETPNPFLPTKHPVTGRIHDPVYSMRRQADLFKLARDHGVEELLPFTTKHTEEKLRRRVELGLRVKGTGVGQKVKGHIYERKIIAKFVASLAGNMFMIPVTDRNCVGWRRSGRQCSIWTGSSSGGDR